MKYLEIKDSGEIKCSHSKVKSIWEHGTDEIQKVEIIFTDGKRISICGKRDGSVFAHVEKYLEQTK